MSLLATIDEPTLAATPTAVSDALEANRVVYFPTCPLPLPDAATLQFLREELPSKLKLKNISYHPEADALQGLKADAATTARVHGLLKSHLHEVKGFLERSAGHLAFGLRVGTCSFRPLEEQGRDLKPHASNELVHIDAGAYGATDGDRILRFFVNVSADADRVWASKGSFDEVLARHGQAAGLLDERGALTTRITKGAADRAFSGLIGGLAALNPLARVLDSSPYDRAMRRLHNYMKDDQRFRDDQTGYQELRFPPGSAWMVFTDGVSHACLSGQFVLVTTMIVKRASLKLKASAPFERLQALAG